jgi:hypothetical protein
LKIKKQPTKNIAATAMHESNAKGKYVKKDVGFKQKSEKDMIVVFS